jgi:hypothetical protein
VVWLKEDGFHAVLVWQVAQSLGIPAATWLGTCAAVKFFWWQLLQTVEVPASWLVWHNAHSTVVCAPVNGKLVVEWLKLFSSQLFCE